jgi:hypothetical protein
MFSVSRFFLLKNDKNTVENHLFYNIKRSAMLRGEYNIHNRSEHVSLENKAKNFNSLCGGGQQNGRPSRTPPPPSDNQIWRLPSRDSPKWGAIRHRVGEAGGETAILQITQQSSNNSRCLFLAMANHR